MVGGRVHGADAVEASWKTCSNTGCQKTLTVAGIINTLEEGKRLRVGTLSGSEAAAEILNGDVAMTDDVSTLQLLGSGVVGGKRISEDTSHQVGNLHLCGESCVWCNVVSRSREQDDGRDHVLVGGNITHNDTVT